MTASANLGLILLEEAQAQKHVTVNAALARLDALAHLRLQSVSVADPPAAPAEGAVWAIPVSPTGAWSGHAGALAVWLTGSWTFVTPQEGWVAWVIDASAVAAFRGGAWTRDAVLGGGARLQVVPIEAEIILASGAVVDSAAIIPANSHIQALSGRVIEAVTGPATFSVGFAGAAPNATFFGSGVGGALGSTWAGMTLGMPFYAATPVRITADGADFTGGRVRVAALAIVSIPPTA